jgi:acetyl-CoA carboxylase biotin carboxyl carrier protein
MEGAVDLALDAGGEDASGPVLRAQGSGRYYHRPAPDEPPFVSPGDSIEEGAVVGLIEVMKTFTHVTYRATGGLPTRARVLRTLVEDGADVVAGTPLLGLEEA